MTTNYHTPHVAGDLLKADNLNSPLSELDSVLSNRTGSDTNVVTGTVGDDGDLAKWNADGDVVEGDPLGSDALGDFDDLTERLEAGEKNLPQYTRSRRRGLRVSAAVELWLV